MTLARTSRIALALHRRRAEGREPVDYRAVAYAALEAAPNHVAIGGRDALIHHVREQLRTRFASRLRLHRNTPGFATREANTFAKGYTAFIAEQAPDLLQRFSFRADP